MLRSTTITVAVAVSAACSDGLAPEAAFLVQESWEWVSACCGIAGQELTPESEGATYVLRFGRDGRVRAIRNGTLLMETGYTVHVAEPDPLADTFTSVRYDDPLPLVPGVEPADEHMVTTLEGGGLLLRSTSPCADCFRDWEFLPRLE
jgi:hypothetical protein